ncbi:hypothetical protein D9758_002954 [Tetrapyrgos nigripes]|uniref:Serine/threonine-protein kinase n=1 Tax=Tetrapyrgos nigripes TaxID=182062 RepID=A0A8H5LTN2_9AGAR|nr:hypothetical protein D9758_002954 [Tetrapyrgos nigripes]
MSAQVYPAHHYTTKPLTTARRYPLANTGNQNHPPQPRLLTTPQKPQVKAKEPASPPLPRQNTKTAPPSPPRIISDPSGHLQYHRVGFLGEGGFARVYEVKDNHHKRYACKVVTKESLKTKKAKTKLYAEIKIHCALEHPNIVKFLDCFEDDDNVYMTLELCTNGSMMDMLRRRRRFSEPEARFYSVQLIGACHYMHTHQVIHRDLKLGNLFLDSNMNIKVGDFGLAALIENPGERKKTICGTPNYIAPEVLFDTANGHSFEVDTWSIGVILYTLVVGRPPFQTKDVKAIYERIRENNYEFPAERPISAQAQALIQTILAKDPQMRPSLHEIIDDPFFTRGTFPSYIPASAFDSPPDFRRLTRQESERNLKRVRRDAFLDEDQITSIAVPHFRDIPSSTSSTTGTSTTASSRHVPPTSIAQQEKEFQKAVQPGSPISALLSSAKRPLIVGTSNNEPRANAAKESTLYRKLQAVSAASTTNPSPLRQSVTASRNQAYGKGVQPVAEEMEDERWKKEQMTRRKELEAQKARIVAQMAPVREEEKEDVEMLPVKKEMRKPSVKENRVPTQAPIAEPQAKINAFESVAHVLTLAFENRAQGRVFKDPRKERTPLTEEKLFIGAWVDYCNRYGMGYALTDGSVGVHFNDTTTLVLSADKQHFDYISARKNGLIYKRKSYTVDDYPEEIASKVYLLKHFEGYIVSHLLGDHDYVYQDTQKIQGMTWVQKYLRMKRVIVFKLSHDVLQFNFADHTKLVLSTHGLVVTLIDKEHNVNRWALSDIMRLSLRIARGAPELDPEEVKTTVKLVDKLKYCKEVLLSIQSASQEEDSTQDQGPENAGVGIDINVGVDIPFAFGGREPKAPGFGSLSSRASKASLR